MPPSTVQEHLAKAREWLGRVPMADGEAAYPKALAECVKAIQALKARRGITDATLERRYEEILTHGTCSTRAETIVARVEDYNGTSSQRQPVACMNQSDGTHLSFSRLCLAQASFGSIDWPTHARWCITRDRSPIAHFVRDGVRTFPGPLRRIP